ncbi:hypothetical protein ACFL9T_16670 [Thermodesulfobacteriota bacterium]
MADGEKRFLTIHYVNGTTQKFEFPIQPDETLSGAARVKELLAGNQLIIELEDRVLIIPFQSIQSIEVSPPPEKMPATALRNARLTD